MKLTRYGRPVRYVALLRGIGPANPNMRNEKLRGVLEELGFANVASVISSGNLLFDTDDGADPAALEELIEAAWPKRLGFESATIVRSQADLERLVAADPFAGRADEPTSRLNVTFLGREPEGEPPLPYRDPAGGYEVLALAEGAVFSAADTTANSTPEMMRWMERTFGKRITTRTWKTVQRIVARMGS